MNALLVVSMLLSNDGHERLARELIANAALALTVQDDPEWHDAQRDCAGLVRYAYRQALRKLEPDRVARGLWQTANGQSGFADAETLLEKNFTRVASPRSGDLAAFYRGDDVYHLMLFVEDHGKKIVVYATGNGPRDVRAGRFESLAREAPREWQPTSDNPAFLGFYRWKEWL